MRQAKRWSVAMAAWSAVSMGLIGCQSESTPQADVGGRLTFPSGEADRSVEAELRRRNAELDLQLQRATDERDALYQQNLDAQRLIQELRDQLEQSRQQD